MNGNSIMAKIAGIKNESVELATQKLQLAKLNDLVQEVNKAEKLLSDFNNLYEKINTLKPQIVKLGNDITQSQVVMNKMGGTLEQQFNEIGLKFSDYPEFKKVSEFMSRSRMVGSMTASIKQL
jgi:hypothetical protein